MEKLKEGEKYLQIKICGHEFVSAFPNKEKSKDNQPDFKADGVAVWVKTKKAEVKEEHVTANSAL